MLRIVVVSELQMFDSVVCCFTAADNQFIGLVIYCTAGVLWAFRQCSCGLIEKSSPVPSLKVFIDSPGFLSKLLNSFDSSSVLSRERLV
jgi:hypothetical protein